MIHFLDGGSTVWLPSLSWSYELHQSWPSFSWLVYGWSRCQHTLNPFPLARLSPTFFWRDDMNFKAQILELSPSSVWVTLPSPWLTLFFQSEVKEAWKALKAIRLSHSLAICGPLHMNDYSCFLKMWNFGDVSHLESCWTDQTTVRHSHMQTWGLGLSAHTTWSLPMVLGLRRDIKLCLSWTYHVCLASVPRTVSHTLKCCQYVLVIAISIELRFQCFRERIVNGVPSSNYPKYLSCNAPPKYQHVETSTIIFNP